MRVERVRAASLLTGVILLLSIFVTHTALALQEASVALGSSAPTAQNDASLEPLVSDLAGTSINWAGYVATGGEFTAVSGTWTVPVSRGSEGISADATWVGIGGVETRDLIQAGTEAIADGETIVYQAWYELLPAPAHPLPVDIAPGDRIHVAIEEIAPTIWRITFNNLTTADSYEFSVRYESSRSSAEWVQEMPASRQTAIYLNYFEDVRFERGYATRDGQTLSIGALESEPLRLVNNDNEGVALPSVLNATEDGFYVRRTAAPSTPLVLGRDSEVIYVEWADAAILPIPILEQRF